MKKLNNIFFKLGICFCYVFLISCHSSSIDIYVSTDGNDSFKGTIKSPVRSIQKGLDIANKKSESYDRICIYLREGRYHLGNMLLIDGNIFSNNLKNLTVAAYDKEKVTITGGADIPIESIQQFTDTTFNFKFSEQIKDKLRFVNLKNLGINDYGRLRSVGFSRPYGPSAMELFINDQPYELARWPNENTIPIGQVIDPGSIPRNEDYSNRGGKFKYNVSRPDKWRDITNIWVSGYFNFGYAEDAVQISNIDIETKEITTAQPTMYGFSSGKPWNNWFAYNIPEEIDCPGEYYIDKKNGIIVFYPYEGKIERMQVSILDQPMISLLNIENVEINDILFECSRHQGLYMENTRNCVIRNCTFRNLGSVGICIGKGVKPFKQLKHEGDGVPASFVLGSINEHRYNNSVFNREAGKNNGIKNCWIYNVGAGGIHMGGGDRINLSPGMNFIENCKIFNYNRLEKSYRAGIDISGVGNIIRNCEIYNAPSMAILMHGNDHLIEYNEIHNVCTDIDDQGAIYYGRDPSERGIKLHNNYLHNIGSGFRAIGIYQDDGACGLEVIGNILYNAGIIAFNVGGGSDNLYNNNLVIGSKIAIETDDRLNRWGKKFIDPGGIFHKRMEAVNFSSPPYSVRYPRLKSYWKNNPQIPNNIVTGNIIFDVEHLVTDEYMKPDNRFLPEAHRDNIVIDSIEAQMVNIYDTIIELETIAKEKIQDWRDIPFHKIGVKKEE